MNKENNDFVKIIKSLVFPFTKNPKINQLFLNNVGGKSNEACNIKIDLPLNIIYEILNNVKKIFSEQPIFLSIDGPINICGDIHGQYADLIQIFYKLGFPSSQNYLFLGDYVDRGQRSLEVILLLFCYKIIYPNSFFMLRGNHETGSISKQYGFYNEIIKRNYPVKLWKKFIDVFNVMPVSCLIGCRILCMHGGLSPSLKNIEDILKIKRPTDIPDEGILCDLLWSDPDKITGWGENERGVSFTFGENVLHEFMKKNGIDLICRGHQVVEDGYEFFGDRRLVTIFSAPRYCGEFDNKGGALIVSKDMCCSFVLFE